MIKIYRLKYRWLVIPNLGPGATLKTRKVLRFETRLRMLRLDIGRRHCIEFAAHWHVVLPRPDVWSLRIHRLERIVVVGCVAFADEEARHDG